MTVNKKKLSRRLRCIVAIITIVASAFVCAFVFALSTYRDAVTNKQKATSIGIELVESNWNDHGEEDAQEMLPGMIIDKDPKVINTSQSVVFVRLRLIIKDENNKTISSKTDKYNAILSSLYMKTKDGSEELLSDSELNNNSFIYYNGNFYYAYLLQPDYSTPTLFDFVKVPVLKKDYQYFDDKFSIEVMAEAVDASTFLEKYELKNSYSSVEDVVDKLDEFFEEVY
jgi:hypothetical protein